MSKTLNRTLVEQAAPVLLGCKPGALFTVEYLAARELFSRVNGDSDRLGVEIMRRQGNRMLVLLYDRSLLASALSQPAAADLLTERNYPQALRPALLHLKRRICTSRDFPHEVGLFLGYPAEDVTGFMRHGGEDCKLCGIWKVYGDVERARRRFAMYENCRSLLADYVSRGGDLSALWITHEYATSEVQYKIS